MKEVSPSRPQSDPERFRAALLRASADYERRGGLSRASELIVAATNLDEKSAVYDDAVSTVLAGRSSNLLRDFALDVAIGPQLAIEPDGGEAEELRFQRDQVRRLRARTRSWPRNAFTWVDLARAYFSIGADVKARRCLRIALAQDPDNRFVVRSAVRFFVHTGDEEAARAAVLKSDALEFDPWLLSAGVAIKATGRRPTLRLARSMIEDGNYSPWNVAELGATIASLEFEHGQEKVARRFMRTALIDPTENVMAHAEWASWASHLQPRESHAKTQPAEANEALARRCAKSFDWAAAASYAAKWQADQPFALDAASLGSWYGIEARDFARAESICTVGLISNPNSGALLNNRAFSLACRWDIEGAARDLARINMSEINAEDLGCSLATAGFVAFRSRDAELGRELYNRAIRLFSLRKMQENAARAAMNLAAEERRENTDLALAAVNRANVLVRQARSPAVERTWNRIMSDDYLPSGTAGIARPRPAADRFLYVDLPTKLRELGEGTGM